MATVVDTPHWAWWLVWCYEHCCKEESRAEAMQLADLACRFHGGTTCLKQPDTLKKHLARRKAHVPWILVTDFRGCIPCMQMLDSWTSPDSLMLMVVHCQKDRQVAKGVDRISQWQQTLPFLNRDQRVRITTGPLSAAMHEVLHDQFMLFGPFGMPLTPMHKLNPFTTSACMSDSGRSTTAGTSVAGDNDHQQQQDLAPSHMTASSNDPYIGDLMLTVPPDSLTQMLENAKPCVYNE